MFDAQPEAFGSYRVLEEIGGGRFGPVYRARDDATGALVAVKVFDQGLTAQQAESLAEALGRLCRAPLDHPTIVPVLAVGTEGDRAWIAEPWIDAEPLDQAMRRDGPQPLGAVILRLTQLAGALDFAAAVGIHHGTLHPRDILVSDDLTLLTGIGELQALGDAGLEVPMEGAYVSPQRAEGLPVAAGDDIFSLAAITYELVTGAPVPPPPALRAAVLRLTGVSGSCLADVLESSISPVPGDRPSTALEFAAALQRALSTPNAQRPTPNDQLPTGNAQLSTPKSELPTPDVQLLPDHAQLATPSAAHPSPDLQLPASTPIPDFASEHVEDLPLRATSVPPEPAPAVRPAVASSAIREPWHPTDSAGPPVYTRPSDSEPHYWLPVAAALAIGILTGFASGFVVGQRDSTPAPLSAERALPRPERPSDASPPPAGGRDFSESDVPSQPVAEQPVIPPSNRGQTVSTGQQDPLRPKEQLEGPGAEPAERSNPREPGTLQIDSRPRGARVFLDGRLVGTTPLQLADVRPGAHAVRIDLSGYRPWVTSVNVAAGARQRVAASLER